MKILRPESKQQIPLHAKQVFHGVLFDVYQWEQEMFDGTKRTFEKIKRKDTVNVIPTTIDKKIIVSHQMQPGVKPFIGVFGGVIEADDTPESAARRELLEETGYVSDSLILLDSTQPISKIDWAIYTFIAKNCTRVSDPTLDAGERIESSLVTFEDFLQLVEKEEFRDTEIALLMLRAKNDTRKLQEIKHMFF